MGNYWLIIPIIMWLAVILLGIYLNLKLINWVHKKFNKKQKPDYVLKTKEIKPYIIKTKKNKVHKLK